MRRHSLIPIAAIALAMSPAPAVAGSSGSRDGLAGVRAASLVQNARSLQWSVTLAHGISRRGIASGARSVCLTFATHPAATAVCVSAVGRTSSLGLTRLAWRHDQSVEVTVPARVTRTGDGHTLTATFRPGSLGMPYRSVRWRVVSSARGRRCSAAGRAGRSAARLCSVSFPANRPARLAMHTPQLVGCVPAGPLLVDQGPADRREIALAFDDGPWSDPPTIDFVDELQRLEVTGTFFEIGEQISEFDPSGSVQRAMLADGDMIGNHTWAHPDMVTLSPAQQTAQLEQTNAAIRHATGFTPCLWRPPYGATSSALETLARGLGMVTINWDIDPRDWALPGTSAIVATVLQQAQNGGITVMHFGGGPRQQTLDALPQIVSDLRARGYRFVNLVQMLGLREVWR